MLDTEITTLPDGTQGECAVIHGSNDEFIIIVPLDESVIVGNKYVFSVYANPTTATRIRMTSGGQAIDYVYYDIPVGWSRLRIPFTASAKTLEFTFDACEIFLYKSQVEEGVIVSDWKESTNILDERLTKAESSIEQNAKEIKLKVSEDGVIAAINLTKEEATINASKINLNGVVTANEKFKINTDGSMEAVDGKFTGTVNATSGSFTGTVNATSGSFTGTVNATSGSFTGTVNATSGSFTGTVTSSNLKATGGSIGGWTISDTDVYNDNGSKSAGIGKTQAFWAGATYANRASAPFRVGLDGSLVATNAKINGNITCADTLYMSNTYTGASNSIIELQKYAEGEESLLYINDSLGANQLVLHAEVSGSAYAEFLVPLVTTTSSRLVKDNIADLTDEEAQKLLDINVVSFDYKDGFGDKNQRGVIAEDVVDIIPSAVFTPYNYNADDFDESKGRKQPLMSVDYSKFVPYLIKMVQIQQKEIQELKEMISKEV